MSRRTGSHSPERSIGPSQPAIKHLLVEPSAFPVNFFPIVALVEAVENMPDVAAMQVFFPRADDNNFGFRHLVPDVGVSLLSAYFTQIVH